jgi:hypothetical protein
MVWLGEWEMDRHSMGYMDRDGWMDGWMKECITNELAGSSVDSDHVKMR